MLVDTKEIESIECYNEQFLSSDFRIKYIALEKDLEDYENELWLLRQKEYKLEDKIKEIKELINKLRVHIKHINYVKKEIEDKHYDTCGLVINNPDDARNK